LGASVKIISLVVYYEIYPAEESEEINRSPKDKTPWTISSYCTKYNERGEDYRAQN